MTERGYSLTDAERRRVDQIDRLVALGSAAVGDLIAGLSDPSWTVRRAVVAALAALGDDAVPQLIVWLRELRTSERAIAAAVDALSASAGKLATAQVMELMSGTPEVAADAAQILGRRRAVEAAPLLGKSLDHDDDNVAVASIEALGAIGGNVAVDALIGVLKRRSFFRTFPALRVLANTNDPRVIVPLTSMLDDESYRIEAARALGHSGFAQAVKPLASLLANGGDPIVRVVALALSDLLTRATWNGSLDHVSDTLRSVLHPALYRFTRALRTADPSERMALARVLGCIGDSSVLPELARLLDESDLRGVATDAIQRISRVHDDALIHALTSRDAATRAAVLPVVHTMRAAETVRALLKDDDVETRARACEALARMGDTFSVPALFSALADPNPRVAHAATAAIHSLGVADTGARTLVALRTGSPAVRRHALRIIAYMGFVEAFDDVVEAVADPDRQIAELAVGSLGMLSEPKVDAMLATLAVDPREGIRAAAMRAAGHRGGPQALHVLESGLADEAAWVRYYACQALGRIGDIRTLHLIVGRLSDAMPHVRIAAIEALAHVETASSWQALCSALRSPDADERRAALASMALRPRDQALAFLLDGAKSDDLATRLIALSGLSRRSEASALAVVASVALDGEPEVRDAALSLLGDRGDAQAANALVEIAFAADLNHAVHHTLSTPGASRITAIAVRLRAANDRTAAILVAALARMRDQAATALLFEAVTFANPAARGAAAGALVAIGAEGAHGVVVRLASSDPDPEVRRICAASAA